MGKCLHCGKELTGALCCDRRITVDQICFLFPLTDNESKEISDICNQESAVNISDGSVGRLDVDLERGQKHDAEESVKRRKNENGREKKAEIKRRRIQIERPAREHLEQTPEQKHFLRQLIVSGVIIAIEITFIVLLWVFDFQSIAAPYVEGFFIIDGILIANTLVLSILDIVGDVNFGGWLSIIVNFIFAIWIFNCMMEAQNGILVWLFALLFFGVAQICVLALCFGILILTNHIRTYGI